MAIPSQIIILVEDAIHQQFIRKYLRRLNIGTHVFRFVPLAAGKGSGEQWVRQQFVVQIHACRRRRAQTKLVVLIDADNQEVQARIRQLDESLRVAAIPSIAENDSILVLLIPKRNIETWILCLNTQNVDEITDYKRTNNDWTSLVNPAIQLLYEWTRPNFEVPDRCIASLRIGIQELKKLDAG